MDAVQPLIDHVRAYPYIYGGALAVLILAGLVLRRFAIPLYLWVLKVFVLATVMHLVIAGFVRLVNIFKGATTLRDDDVMTLRDADVVVDKTPGWTTPLFQVWDKTLYNPEWLIYLELGLAIAIVFLLGYFKPPLFLANPDDLRSTRVKNKPQTSKFNPNEAESFMSGSVLSKTAMLRTKKTFVHKDTRPPKK